MTRAAAFIRNKAQLEEMQIPSAIEDLRNPHLDNSMDLGAKCGIS
jgi:hypothetical protein